MNFSNDVQLSQDVNIVGNAGSRETRPIRLPIIRPVICTGKNCSSVFNLLGTKQEMMSSVSPIIWLPCRTPNTPMTTARVHITPSSKCVLLEYGFHSKKCRTDLYYSRLMNTCNIRLGTTLMNMIAWFSVQMVCPKTHCLVTDNTSEVDTGNRHSRLLTAIEQR